MVPVSPVRAVLAPFIAYSAAYSVAYWAVEALAMPSAAGLSIQETALAILCIALQVQEE